MLQPFSDSSSLTRHRRIHPGKRPYKCPYAGCQKTFTRRTALTRHQNSHSGTVEDAAAKTNAKLSSAENGSAEGGDADLARLTSCPSQRPTSVSASNQLFPIPNTQCQTPDDDILHRNEGLASLPNDVFRRCPSPASPGTYSLSTPANFGDDGQHPYYPRIHEAPQPIEPPAIDTRSGGGWQLPVLDVRRSGFCPDWMHLVGSHPESNIRLGSGTCVVEGQV
jgi:hypothetical protein